MISMLLLMLALNNQPPQAPCSDYYTKGNGTCLMNLDNKAAVYFREDGTPYQCGPMTYYGALCWTPKGIPNAARNVKGYLWALIPEVPPATH